METLQIVLHVFQVVIAVALIGFILIQHGKGADAGAAFGSGASATVFGSQGSGNFLTKATTVLACLFLLNSLTLGYLATQMVAEPTSVMEAAAVVEEQASVDMSAEIPVIETEADVSESEIPSIPVE